MLRIAFFTSPWLERAMLTGYPATWVAIRSRSRFCAPHLQEDLALRIELERFFEAPLRPRARARVSWSCVVALVRTIVVLAHRVSSPERKVDE